MPSPIREFHRRNSPKTQYFVAYDTAGQPIVLAGATGRLSKDGGAFSDCTNLPTSIGRGLHSITLTAAESNADNLGLVVTALSTGYCPAAIISTAVLEMSQLNIMGATTGACVNIINSLSPAGTGFAILIESTGANCARFRTGNTGQNAVLFDGRFLGNHALAMTSWLGAGISTQSNGVGFQAFGNTYGLDVRSNNVGAWIDGNTINDVLIRSNARDSSIKVIGPTGSTQPLINIIHPATGRIPAIKVQCTPTGGGSAVELSTANYLSFSLELSHANATGQCIKFGGYLPEPTMPIDKDTFTIMDAISFITASMTNRVALNKDTLIHTLYQRDNSSTLVSRGVSDDGTTQGMSATD